MAIIFKQQRLSPTCRWTPGPFRALIHHRIRIPDNVSVCVASAASRTAGHVTTQVYDEDSFCPFSRCSHGNAWPCLAPAFFLGLASCVAFMVLSHRQRRASFSEVAEFNEASMMHRQLQQDEQLMHGSASTELHHQRALARSRQTCHINRALQLAKSGEKIMAYMELCRALHENNICLSRSYDCPLAMEDQELLYRLHLQSCEMPPNFAQLLQVQKMLGIEQQVAEQMEEKLVHAPMAFSI